MSNQDSASTLKSNPIQLDPTLLKFNGILSFIYAAISFIYIVSTIALLYFPHLALKLASSFFAIINLILTIYLLYQFSQLFLIRFQLNFKKLFYSIIIISIPTTIIGIVSIFVSYELDIYSIIQVLLLFIFGIIYLIFGIKLLKAKINYPYFQVFSILMIITGGSLVSVCLSSAGMFVALALDIIMGLIFLKVKSEIIST